MLEFSSTVIPEKHLRILQGFCDSYAQSLSEQGKEIEEYKEIFETYLHILEKQFQNPFSFEPYHEQMRAPFDYYAFGVQFLRPLVDKNPSYILGEDEVKEMVSYLKNGDNVILLANHQIEADPQALSLLLEDICPEESSKMISVAGERVVTDPLAVPFSMGRNLLCIYSKRYIDHPPEEKLKKQLHNKKTMEQMSQLLKRGGQWIYVAPSGGRDRPDSHGVVQVAPFDPQSIEMFYLMAKKSGKKTHFYPLALKTYDLLPPPKDIQKELGEKRITKSGPIFAFFGKEIPMDALKEPSLDKRENRKKRAEYIFNLVKEGYERLTLRQKGHHAV